MPSGRFATIRAINNTDRGTEVTLQYENGEPVRILAKHLRGSS